MHRRAALLALSALGLAACGSGEAAAPPSPAATVGVGQLPGDLSVAASTTPVTSPTGATASSDAPDETTDGTDVSVPTTDGADAAGSGDPQLEPIGRVVSGNRVLVIGDSILASVSDRYGGQLCARLVPRGWTVEVDAEVAQRIGFAGRVLDKRLAAGWDAAVIMLGNNYDGDPAAYGQALEQVMDELAPMPVVLLTVTRFRDVQDEVNYVLHALADREPRVHLLDWAARTSDATPDAATLLGDDGLHLSDAGREALAVMVSRAMGDAPQGAEGACLRSTFTNDSAGSVDGGSRSGSGSGSGSGTGTGSGSGSGSGSGTGSGSGSGTGTGSGSTGSGRSGGSGGSSGGSSGSRSGAGAVTTTVAPVAAPDPAPPPPATQAPVVTQPQADVVPAATAAPGG